MNTKKTYELNKQTISVLTGMSTFFGISEKSIIETAICQPQVLVVMEVTYFKNEGNTNEANKKI